MKFTLSFTFLWLGVIPLLANSNNTNDSSIETQISAVVVYADGARVTRQTLRKTIPKGTHRFILKGLPESFVQNSLEAQLNTHHAKVVSLSVSKNYSNLFSDSEYTLAKDALDKAQFNLDSISMRMNKLSEAIQTLKNLKPKPPSAEKAPYPLSFDMNAWENFIDFTQAKLFERYAQIQTLVSLQLEARQTLEVAQNNYNKVSSKRTPKEESLLEVKISANQSVEANIDVSYRIKSAMWRPCYDLRVNPETAELTLVSYAIVQQNTGENWNEVPISFSTATPSGSNQLPTFTKQMISEKVISASMPQPSVMDCGFSLASEFSSVSQKSKSSKLNMPRSPQTLKEDILIQQAQITSDLLEQQTDRNYFYNNNMSKNNRTQIQLTNNKILDVDHFEIQGNQINYNQAGQELVLDITSVKMLRQNVVEQDNNVFNIKRLTPPSFMVHGLDYRYELARLEKIPSDGIMHKYLLNSAKYKGTFYYEIVSSVNNNAYMVNEMINHAFKPILTGPTNIFYGEDFIGEGHITYTPQDCGIPFYLGVDPRVKVERKVSKFTETIGVISQERKTSLDIEISITNHTPKIIQIRTTEYLPTSGEGKVIRINPLNFTPPAQININAYSWVQNISPSKTIKFNAKCDIFYPLNYLISTEGHGDGFGPAIDQYTKEGK